MNEKQKNRVAIGAFDRLDSLSKVLEALDPQKAEEVQAVLIVGQNSLEDELRQALEAGSLSSSEGWPTVVFCGAESPADQKFSGASIKGASISRECERIVEFEQWIAPTMANRLNQQLTNGACLLFAIVDTPDQEQQVCGVLFEHSINQVQVHDFSLE